MCIEMFPRNKISIIYRLLCLISYIIVIIMTSSIKTLIVISIVFWFFASCEKSFRNIELIVLTIIFLLLSYSIGNYLLFRIILLIDYLFYFIGSGYYYEEKEVKKIDEKKYIRFQNNKKKKKGTGNITAIYLTVHLVLLFVAIMVG